jgi:hypothetical protein
MDRMLRSLGCIAALLAASCGARGDFNTGPIGESCTAGQREECVCESTMSTGSRFCGADLHFTACVCDGVDAGVVVTDDLGAPGRDVPVGLDRGVTEMDVPAVGLDRGVVTGSGAFGTPCTRLDQCASGVCLPTGRCSRTCTGATDCPTTIGWTCTALPGLGPVCGCTPRGVETCNGLDDDCDGVADNGITRCGSSCVDLQTDPANCGGCGIACGGGTSCVRGACLCPASLPTACGGRCVDGRNDPNNCGSCDNRCPSGQRCEGGRCTGGTTGMCPSSCGASSDCGSCRTPSDPAGSTYCCLSGLCIYTSSSTCAVDAGLVDLPTIDLPAVDSSGGSDVAGLD